MTLTRATFDNGPQTPSTVDKNGVQLSDGDYVKVPEGADRPYSVGVVEIYKDGTYMETSVLWADSKGCFCGGGPVEDLSTLVKSTVDEYNEVRGAFLDKLANEPDEDEEPDEEYEDEPDDYENDEVAVVLVNQ